MKVRTHLLLLTLGSLFPVVVLAAAAGWILATGAPVFVPQTLWLIAIGTLGALDQVAEKLRTAPGRDNMVLIALTGFGQPDSLRRAHEAGFGEYVTKPIAPERLVRLMDVALAARARRRSSPGMPTLRSPSARV